MGDQDLMTNRSWRWLKTRIEGLLEVPPTVVPTAERALIIPATRLGFALNPPGQE